MKKILGALLTLLIATSIVQCGQKGGLTRPEQNNFTTFEK